MAKRTYTGNKDGQAKGLRPGMKVFIDEVIKLSNGALWNNGDFVVRNMKGKSHCLFTPLVVPSTCTALL